MKSLWMMFLAASISVSANVDKDLFITIGADAVFTSQKSVNGIKTISNRNGITVLKIKSSEVENLSKLMHDNFNRCGGFIVHDSEQEALEVISNSSSRNFAKNADFLKYSITESNKVESMVSKVNEFNIREMIIKLSTFNNRYYKAKTGVQSQDYIKGVWESLAGSRTDVSVDYYKHSSFPQPSLIMTVEGKTKKDEVIVIGGHADSIAGFWGRTRARAPGADDNASGIATITEVIRIMMDSSYKPQRTVKFMAYAAEEVGLLGSKAIANDYKKQGKSVVGVVQFDMTNHKGTKDLDIVFMTDFTNQAQNKFMGALIDTYLSDVKWGYSKCGYGCSDHASWHNAGYPASMPFESTMGDINGKIHTRNDTIEASGSMGTANHAEKFAKLGVAYLVEMGK